VKIRCGPAAVTLTKSHIATAFWWEGATVGGREARRPAEDDEMLASCGGVIWQGKGVTCLLWQVAPFALYN